MIFAHLPQVLIVTIVQQIAVLLLDGAQGDIKAAQHAAAATLSAYEPHDEAEFRLAARIVAFSLQANQALAQAAAPDMPLQRVLRLRSGAVSLARESEKAERRLDALRQARARGLPPPDAGAEQPESAGAARAVTLVEDTRKVAAYAKAHGLTWTQAYNERNREQRRAERQRKGAMRAKAAMQAGAEAAGA